MKYSWSLRRFWLGWLKRDMQRFWYRHVYGFNMDGWSGTMLPDTGKGKYVSVYRKSDIIQIVDETGESNEIRIIPYQPNHGVMVECLDKKGELIWRNHLDIDQLNKQAIYASNIENLIK